MSVSAIPVNLSNWVPLSATYKYDEYIQLYTTPVTTGDGYTVFEQDALKGPKDNSINKSTIMHVPSSSFLLDFLYDKGKPDLDVGDYVTVVVDISGTSYYMSAEDDYLKLNTDTTSALYLKIRVNDDKTLSFLTEKNKLITVTSNEPLNLYLDAPLPTSESYRQKFGYIIYDINSVAFYTTTTSNQRFWAYRTDGPNAYMVRANGYIASGQSTPSNNYIFNIHNFEDYIRYNNSGLVIDHHLVKYSDNIDNKVDNKNVNIKEKTKISVQHLIDNPYHETIGNDTSVNIANLKSIMTGEYNYKDENISLRDYNKIFSGGNEDGGKEKISLSYEVTSKQLSFYTDIHNIFTYPSYAISMALSASSLINDGAFGGTYPQASDRIKYANICVPLDEYSMKDPFGIYLTTWLYKSELNSESNSIWMDRWYNPGYISEKEALLEPYGSGHSGIKDVTTKFHLLNGVEYDYFHYGNYTNNELLTANNNSLKLHFDDWNETGVQLVNATVKNDSYLIVNRDIPVIEKPYNDYIDANEIKPRIINKVRADNVLDITNNSSYGNIAYTSATDLNSDFSFSIWLKTNDWTNGNYHHLVSNGFRSGWNLKINNGFYNPLLTFVTNTSGIIVYNVEGKLVYNYNLNLYEISSYAVDENLYTYILGRETSISDPTIFKLDLTTGTVVDSVTANLTDEKLLFNNVGILSGVLNTNDFDLSGNLSASNYPFDFDNYGNKWEARGSAGIYRNDTLIYDVSALNIICSHDDRIWTIVYENSTYNLYIYDVSQIDTILSNSVLTLNNTLDYENIIPITGTNNILFDLVYVDNGTIAYIVDLDFNHIYRTDINGKVVFTDNFYNPNGNTFIKNSFTTYKWNRKFNYIKNDRNTVVELNVAEKDIDDNVIINTLQYNTSGTLVDNAWHHFAVTMSNSAVNLYVDTVSVGQLLVDDIFHIYETPILIGTRVSKTNILTEVLKNDYYDYFRGYADDFRLYDKLITQSDIEHIYTDKFRYKDLLFNVSTIPLYYIEEIDRFFKFKLPGSKSPYYNIKISGLGIVNDDTKAIIESIIKNSVKYIAPAYSELYRIIWVE